MEVIDKYDPVFIFADGDSTGPFAGEKTGTCYKRDAMRRVMAECYNHVLATRGNVDTFSIVRFHPRANGSVNTAESRFPKAIWTGHPWIGENALGDGFTSPASSIARRRSSLVIVRAL